MFKCWKASNKTSKISSRVHGCVDLSEAAGTRKGTTCVSKSNLDMQCVDTLGYQLSHRLFSTTHDHHVTKTTCMSKTTHTIKPQKYLVEEHEAPFSFGDGVDDLLGYL